MTSFNLANDYDPNEIWEQKVGYDSANKRMIAKVYNYLWHTLECVDTKKSWSEVIRQMLGTNPDGLCINGYYGTIRTILKDIKVIKYEGKTLTKGVNWNRFYSNENWDWFKTSTNSGGCGILINIRKCS